VPASDGGAPILDYTVTASPGGTQATSTTTSASVAPLNHGVPYTFTVTARNAAGSSPASTPSAPATPTAPLVGSGSVYYISPSGNDSAAGGLATPWATFMQSLPKLLAGDTLIVRSGLYSETVSYPPTRNGTAANRIIIQNYPGERPVICGFLHLTNISFWTFDGLNITWPPGGNSATHMVKLGTGDSWHLTNSELWGASSYACLHVNQNPVNFLVDYCYIHDNPGPHGTNNQDHCIYVDPGPTSNGTIERNVLANAPFGRGVKIGLPSSKDPTVIGNVTIRYNTCYNNGGPANIQLSYTASNNTIYRNILQKPRSISTTNITLNTSSGTGNIAYDNVAWESSGVMPASSVHLTDGGGNFVANPQFVAFSTNDNHAWNVASTLDWHPQNTAVQAYGRYAP